jgi:hypothetical protein
MPWFGKNLMAKSIEPAGVCHEYTVDNPFKMGISLYIISIYLSICLSIYLYDMASNKPVLNAKISMIFFALPR